MKSVLNKSQAVAAKKVLKRRSVISAVSKCSLNRTGSKEVRAEPFAAQVQGGNVSLVILKIRGTCSMRSISFPYGSIATRSTPAAARSTA